MRMRTAPAAHPYQRIGQAAAAVLSPDRRRLYACAACPAVAPYRKTGHGK
jgi:hypothetical protein